MKQNTKGTWKLEGSFVHCGSRLVCEINHLDPSNAYLAQYHGAGLTDDEKQARANGYLIAAAPALLEALINLTDFIDDAEISLSEHDGALKYRQAFRAIKKAKGEL